MLSCCLSTLMLSYCLQRLTHIFFHALHQLPYPRHSLDPIYFMLFAGNSNALITFAAMDPIYFHALHQLPYPIHFCSSGPPLLSCSIYFHALWQLQCSCNVFSYELPSTPIPSLFYAVFRTPMPLYVSSHEIIYDKQSQETLFSLAMTSKSYVTLHFNFVVWWCFRIV